MGIGPDRSPAFGVFSRLLAQQQLLIGTFIEPLNSELACLKRADITPEEVVEARERFQTTVRAFQFALEWLTVMLVTATETYLQDALAYAAKMDPELMAKSDQHANYREILAAESLEALAQNLRHRWARRFLERGGPIKWVDRLTRMGASGYASKFTEPLELIWGIRHLVVHPGGTVNPDFIERHGSSFGDVGATLQLDPDRISVFIDAVKNFVSVTDQFLVRRFGMTTAEQTPA